MVMFVEQENMTPVQLALETARYELSKLHGLHVAYDNSDVASHVIDTTEAVERVDDALRSLGFMDTYAKCDTVNSMPDDDNNECYYLSKQEATDLKLALLHFVIRVSDGSEERWLQEIDILPAVTELLLKGFSRH